tara:strand:- start:2808 stop:5885 length:3078 start_codon:yes stop_codon:yes gene_type:complete
VRGVGSIAPGPSTQFTDESAVLFSKVAEQVMHGHRDLFDDLTPHERTMVLEWLADAVFEGKADTALSDVLWEVDYRQKPATIEEFIEDDFYLGRSARDLHPAWKEDLYEIFRPGSQIVEWFLTGAIGVGKRIADDTPVATPSGWKANGDLEVGDFVIGSDGKPTEVLGVYHYKGCKLYRVTFSDGTSVDADGEHLWQVSRLHFKLVDGKQKRVWIDEVVDTDELRERKLKQGDAYTHRIPIIEPVRYPERDLPVAPYTLGVLLGDGCLTKGSIEFSAPEDPEIADRVASELPEGHVLSPGDLRWIISKGSCGGSKDSNEVMAAIRQLGLAGHRSLTKFVPAIYLTASVGQRLDVLRGLMDTDGTVIGRNTTTFSTGSEQLARDVIELTQSLGGIATISHFDRDDGNREFAVRLALDVCPFYLERKAKKWSPRTNQPVRRAIVSIEMSRIADATCIRVAAKDSLYAVRDYILTHNTTLACVAQAYKLHCLSCLRQPAGYYGLLPDSQIVFGIYSITKNQVADAGYFKLRGFIDNSPYFRTKFPRSRKIDSKLVFQRSPVTVVPGSQEMHALGLDLFAFMMDEVNFMRSKENKETGKMLGQAYDLYNATKTRLLSRFMRPGGTIPGMMLLMSSRNAETSFLEERLRNVDPRVTYVSDYALWEVKPKHLFQKPKFKVEIGDRTAQSRLLRAKETPRKGARVVEVPGEFRAVFEEDVDQALRDIAGVATFNLSPLIRDRESVFAAISDDMEHPFTRDVATLDIEDDTTLDEFYDIRRACRVVASRWTPKLNPEAPRFIHVDIALSGDCLGFAMGHAAAIVDTQRMTPDGVRVTQSEPYIVIDLMMRIVPPKGSEIDLSKIRSFILYLSKLYRIARVTFDRFQSADSIQILKKLQFEAGHQSVDRDDEAYLMLRAALFDRRLLTYRYEPFIDELLDLQRDAKSRKVDHPTKSSKGGKGSKDVSDGVAGVVYLCMTDPRATKGARGLVANDDTIRVTTEKALTRATVAKPADPKVAGANISWDDLARNLDQ